VVITGLGVVAPTGIGKSAFWDACKQGRSGIGPITRFDTDGYNSKIAGEVRDFDPLDYMAPKKAKRSDRFTHFAIASAKMAVEDARLDPEKLCKERIGVYFGTAMGGMPFAELQHSIFMEKGIGRVSPFLAETIFPGATSSHIAIEFDVRGVNGTISRGCSSGSEAIGQALDSIRIGRADAIIAGGTEDPLGPLTFGSFCIIKALATTNHEPQKATRPFDMNRNGFALSEGAGTLILESLEHAEKRGARIYAELKGYGCSCDAYHMVHPGPDGTELGNAMKLALRDANLGPEEVDYINAHGTATVLNDIAETKAIKQVFGERAYRIPISSIKSSVGHTWGAAGAVESIASVLAIHDRFIPPTINYETRDPECDLDYVPNEGRTADLNLVVSNSSSFGGKNSVLVISRFEDGRQG
jgi:3-oxoacyl-[acyl-carrier-protein] synthase II